MVKQGDVRHCSYSEFARRMKEGELDRIINGDAVLYLYPSMKTSSLMIAHYEYDNDSPVSSPDRVLKEDIVRLLEKHKHEKKNYSLVMTPRGVNMFYHIAFENSADFTHARTMFNDIRVKLGISKNEFFVDKAYPYLGYDKEESFLYIPTEDICQSKRNKMFGASMNDYAKEYYEYLIEQLQFETVSRIRFFKSIML